MDLTREEFKAIQNLIFDNSGLHFEESKMDLLRSTLLKRVRLKNLQNFSQYCEYLKFHPEGAAELKGLLSLITVQETNFFRHPDQFRVFKEHLLSELIGKNLQREDSPRQTLSIWSAGCSSGEEPYSIAISVLESGVPYNSWNIEILGTDIDEKILSRARTAIYSEKSVRHVDDNCIDRYFEKVGIKYRLKDEVRNMVKFKRHNLVNFSYPTTVSGGWDVIFCRNVVIYFTRETFRQVVRNIHNYLSVGGYLILGYSESLHDIRCDYSLIRIGDVFVYKKKRERCIKTCPAVPASAVIRTPEAQDKYKTFYRETLEHFIKEEYDKAMCKVMIFIRGRPEDAQGHLLAGRLYLEKGLVEQAAEEMKKAIEIEPFLAPAYYFLGITCERQNRIDEAANQYKKALYLDQNFTLAHFNLASIYMNDGNIEGALRGYRNAIKCLKRIISEEPIEYAGTFNARVLMETCQRNVQRLLAKISRR